MYTGGEKCIQGFDIESRRIEKTSNVIFPSTSNVDGTIMLQCILQK